MLGNQLADILTDHISCFFGLQILPQGRRQSGDVRALVVLRIVLVSRENLLEKRFHCVSGHVEVDAAEQLLDIAFAQLRH